jgi:hypothetical protein
MKRIKSGDIIQIPLPKDFGFAYAKYINLIEFSPQSNYPDLIRVYDFVSKLPVIDINELKDRDFLFSPILVGGLAPTIKNRIWKIVGHLTLSDNDNVIPHYKVSEPIGELEENAKRWYYVVDGNINKKYAAPIGNVQHLEYLGAIGTDYLGTKIAMEYLKKCKKDIKDYFDLKEYHEKFIYNRIINKPLYSEINKELRDVAHDKIVEKFIIDSIGTNSKGVEFNYIKEYLEYYNQTTYSNDEVLNLLSSLKKKGIIIDKNDKWKRKI